MVALDRASTVTGGVVDREMMPLVLPARVPPMTVSPDGMKVAEMVVAPFRLTVTLAIVAVGFGDDEVNEAVEVDFGFDVGPVGLGRQVGRIEEGEQIEPAVRGAFFRTESGRRAGHMPVEQVVDLVRRDLVFLGKPRFIPPLPDIVDAEIGPVDKDDGGTVIGGVHIQLPLGEFGKKAVAQHVLVPVVAAVAERQGGVNGNPAARKKVVGDVVVAVFPADREVERFLRVAPVVFAADADAAAGGESQCATGGEELDVAGRVLAFVDVVLAVGTGDRFVVVGVDADGVAEERFGVGHDGHRGQRPGGRLARHADAPVGGGWRGWRSRKKQAPCDCIVQWPICAHDHLVMVRWEKPPTLAAWTRLSSAGRRGLNRANVS